ncbi:MAG: glycosyltransferase [Prosthecobacter sp.]|uniref:bifunctional class I SAM-dependent methyltransferase/glycosyltransferase family 2 protein n=1 Tax=Prosthecobacter sp. TaxID=1965333 RepID=UPI0025DC6002|nr:bifunctional class I SAM-dependent methyltransferase/glycosyltransferase family 2 protein [Prosthecobacter sp.]MCF7787341.1 glycosyltransferase [Prosthecobacter sp.]
MSDAPTPTPPETPVLWGMAAIEGKRQSILESAEAHADERDYHISRNKYFYDLVGKELNTLIGAAGRLLFVRCQTGKLLDYLSVDSATAVEVSAKMTDIARQKYPHVDVRLMDPEKELPSGPFDTVLIQDTTDTVDIQAMLDRVRAVCLPHTRIIIFTYNHLWEPLVALSEKSNLKTPKVEPNWLSVRDYENLLHLSGLEMLRVSRRVLMPFGIPLLAPLLNKFIAWMPLIDRLNLCHFIVARRASQPSPATDFKVSVIIPCKDEKGNVRSAIERMPQLGRETEIIFCDDKSTDGTADEVRLLQAEFPHKNIRLVDGPAISKSRNVWTGFAAATGDILMILDADLTVMPEELPRFVEAIASGKGEFINGSRMVYPMQGQAMKFANMLGNKGFATLFSYLLGSPVRDTLCGTKVLWRKDWEKISRMIDTWGAEDRWGDYELLFGAAKLNLRIVDLPVHYQERVYGDTKMNRRFKNGLVMLRFCWAAFLKLKLPQM